MRDLIAMVSFLVAVIGALSAIFNRDRDRQTMSAIVAIVFLISFFINIRTEVRLVYQTAGVVTFTLSVLSGIVAMFSKERNRRDMAIVTGTVSLGTSLLIFFAYL